MQIQSVFLVFLVFLIGVNCASLENSTASENETISGIDDRCIQECGSDPSVTCVWDLTYDEDIICGCKDETETYDKKSRQCIDRCVQVCGSDPSVMCVGDLTSDQNITCGCRNEIETYDKKNRQCIERCRYKCGSDSNIECRGNQTADETTICGCKDPNQMYDKERQKCKVDSCTSNTCKNGGTCRSRREGGFECICTEFYGGKDCSENVRCDIRWQYLCGKEKCHYNATVGRGYCVCQNGKVFDKSSKTCIGVHCATNPCRNGGTCSNRINTYKCKCPKYYGGKDCSENRICYLHGKELCGKQKCRYDKERMEVKCFCSDGKVYDMLSKRCIGKIMLILLPLALLGVLGLLILGIVCCKRNQKLKEMSKPTAIYQAPQTVMS